jgi:PAS domain S-box-containing protein
MDPPEALSAAIAIVDRDGIIRSWNRAATELFGHPAERAVGASIEIVIPATYRERHWAGFRRAWEQGHVREGLAARLPMLCADGVTRPTAGRLAGIYGAHGDLVAVMGVWTGPRPDDEQLYPLG